MKSLWTSFLVVIAAALSGVPSGSLAARDYVTESGGQHPAMTDFLEEIEAGKLEAAAARLSRMGDFDTGLWASPFAFNYSREEFVAFLAECEQQAIEKRVGSYSVQKTEWRCSDSTSYFVDFWPEDFMVADKGLARPYLRLVTFETPKMRADREAAKLARDEAKRAKYDGNIPPPPLLRMYTAEEQRAARERRAHEDRAAAGYRDAIGKAVISNDLTVLAQYMTDETEVRYATLDPHFNVAIEHDRGKGIDALQMIVQRAINEIGQPLTVECSIGDGKWPPHVCRWTLSNQENALFAEMNFRGPEGMLNSFRVFRETPDEMENFRLRAIEAGVING